jgi:putative glutamine amidotransferase
VRNGYFDTDRSITKDCGMVSRPLIGVTTSEVRLPPNSRPLKEGDPPQRELALGALYVRAVELAGGLPVVLPPLALEAVPALLDHLSGICLSGGPDLDPAAYGAAPHAHLGPTEPDMDAFELAVALEADRRELPILGICRGLQTLNVARGGTLHQHVADVTDGTIAHRQSASALVPTHDVRIEPTSRLAQVLGVNRLPVNTFHHQAVEKLGRGLRAVAWAPDGLVEGIESEGEGLLLGVQWHAESLGSAEPERRLFEALVRAAGEVDAGGTARVRAA